jgi:hypothetical protein
LEKLVPVRGHHVVDQHASYAVGHGVGVGGLTQGARDWRISFTQDRVLRLQGGRGCKAQAKTSFDDEGRICHTERWEFISPV